MRIKSMFTRCIALCFIGLIALQEVNADVRYRAPVFGDANATAADGSRDGATIASVFARDSSVYDCTIRGVRSPESDFSQWYTALNKGPVQRRVACPDGEDRAYPSAFVSFDRLAKRSNNSNVEHPHGLAQNIPIPLVASLGLDSLLYEDYVRLPAVDDAANHDRTNHGSPEFSLFPNQATEASLSSHQAGALSLAAKKTGTLVVDGDALEFAITDQNEHRLTFAGAEGQRLFLWIGADDNSSKRKDWIRVYVTKPDGTLLDDCSFLSRPAEICYLKPLQDTGQYIVHLVRMPDSSDASVKLALSSESSNTIERNGPDVTFEAVRPGQAGQFSFEAQEGESLRILFKENTFGTIFYLVAQPDGTILTLGYLRYREGAVSRELVDLSPLPKTGKYRVYVRPYGADLGKISLALKQGVVLGALNVNGPPYKLLVPEGQKAKVAFVGKKGERIGLNIGQLRTNSPTGSLNITVSMPGGGVFQHCGEFSKPEGTCYLSTLPESGNYAVWLLPGDSEARLTLDLHSETTEALALNETAKDYSMHRSGQNISYKFSGRSGQYLSFLISGINAPLTQFVVYQPDGMLFEKVLMPYTDDKGSVELLNLDKLPQTGIYTLSVRPARPWDGELRLFLKENSTMGSLVIDGSPVGVSLPQGRNGRYQFDGKPGQWVALKLDQLVTDRREGTLEVFVTDPFANSLVKCGRFSDIGGDCDLGVLREAGTYTIWLAPMSAGASMKLALTSR